MLRQLGWDIKTAEEAGLNKKIDDTKWVIYARKNHRISVTFDELKAKQGEKVSRELRRHGGKIIRINGAHNEFRAIGKLLYHYYDWYQFLKDNEGISVLADIRPQGYKNFTPEEYHQHYHHVDAQLFEKYLERRKLKLQLPIKHRKPRKTTPKEQQGMIP